MPQFLAIPNERSRHYSPVAIRLVDAFTLGEPIGKTSLQLQVEVATDVWQSDGRQAFQNGNGVYSYPGLGRSADADRPPRNYRVQVDSVYYEPYKPMATDLFPVHFYNEAHPLTANQYAQGVRSINLQPNSNYPYPREIPRVVGRITRSDGTPFEGAELRHQSLEVKSSKEGEFTIPVRIPAEDTFTTDNSNFNTIKVQNARGYAKAVLEIRHERFRVSELTWKAPLDPTNYEATLELEPLGLDDLEPLPSGTIVSLVSFALLIDIPPYAPTEVDQFFDLQLEDGFQKFHSIVIPTTP